MDFRKLAFYIFERWYSAEIRLAILDEIESVKTH